MRHRVFAIVSAVSLLLCLAAVTAWLRSLGHADEAVWSRPGRHFEIQSIEGIFSVAVARDSPTGLPGGWSLWRHALPASAPRPNMFAFQVIKTPEARWVLGNRRLLFVSVPCWFAVLITAPLPLRWLALRLQSRLRNRIGYCPACGYNLTGNTTGICSECGVVVSEARVQYGRRARRVVLALTVLPVALLSPFIGRTVLDHYLDHLAWKKLLVREQQYLDYTAAPDRIVYAEDPLTVRRLAGDPKYVSIGSCVCYVPPMSDEVPGIHVGFNGGPVLFLHARRAGGGETRLVCVGLLAVEDCEQLRADVLVPTSNSEPLPRTAGQSDLLLRRWNDQHMTFMAGQPDPSDSSHFTIGYRLDDQPGTIDGWLTDNTTVKLQVRDGPAQMLKTSPTAIPFFGGKWGGTPPAKKAQ